jgi:hypothetical protein
MGGRDMGRFKTGLVLLGLAAGWLLCASAATAGDHGIFTIQNPTKRPIHYQMKWGDNARWQTYTLQPGASRWHAYPLDCHACAPSPYVRFDYILGDDDVTWKSYIVEFFASSSLDAPSGKPYHFEVVKNGRELELFEGERPQRLSTETARAAEEALRKVQDLVRAITEPLAPPSDIPPDIARILDLK